MTYESTSRFVSRMEGHHSLRAESRINFEAGPRVNDTLHFMRAPVIVSALQDRQLRNLQSQCGHPRNERELTR